MHHNETASQRTESKARFLIPCTLANDLEGGLLQLIVLAAQQVCNGLNGWRGGSNVGEKEARRARESTCGWQPAAHTVEARNGRPGLVVLQQRRDALDAVAHDGRVLGRQQRDELGQRLRLVDSLPRRVLGGEVGQCAAEGWGRNERGKDASWTLLARENGARRALPCVSSAPGVFVADARGGRRQQGHELGNHVGHGLALELEAHGVGLCQRAEAERGAVAQRLCVRLEQRQQRLDAAGLDYRKLVALR